jgi:hypothetical protein
MLAAHIVSKVAAHNSLLAASDLARYVSALPGIYQVFVSDAHHSIVIAELILRDRLPSHYPDCRPSG